MGISLAGGAAAAILEANIRNPVCQLKGRGLYTDGKAASKCLHSLTGLCRQGTHIERCACGISLTGLDVEDSWECLEQRRDANPQIAGGLERRLGLPFRGLPGAELRGAGTGSAPRSVRRVRPTCACGPGASERRLCAVPQKVALQVRAVGAFPSGRLGNSGRPLPDERSPPEDDSASAIRDAVP